MRAAEQKLRTTVQHEGQKYVDEPIYVQPKFEPGPMAARAVQRAMAAVLEEKQPVIATMAPALCCFAGPVEIRAMPPAPERKPPILVGYERVRLRWVKPDGKGGFEPK